MLTLVKLGGSAITDKRVEATYREEVARQLARDIRRAMSADASLKLIVGHGSGSFGHFAARRYRTIDGVHTGEEWWGFAEVAVVASELNYLVAKTFFTAGIPVFRVQPSASAISVDSDIGEMSLEPIIRALQNGLVPLVYGDVAFDNVLGGTILSTETIFFYLAQHLPVGRILLLGDVEGVLDTDGGIIPEITAASFSKIEPALGGSAGVDVTGGMAAKVRDMLALVKAVPALTIRIFDGLQPGLLEAVLLGNAQPGTLISHAPG